LKPMNPDNDKKLQEEFLYHGLGFSGAITASVTHELNNVLGTIEQLSGLLEDLAYSISEGKSISEDQMNSLAERIAKQTKRGTVIIKGLNSFAHSSDSEYLNCNLYDIIENISALSNRLARAMRSEIVAVVPDEEIFLWTSPLLVKHIVFLIMKSILPMVKRDTEIQTILTSNSGESVVSISFECEGTGNCLTIDKGIISLASKLPASINSREDSNRFLVDIKIPFLAPKT